MTQADPRRTDPGSTAEARTGADVGPSADVGASESAAHVKTMSNDETTDHHSSDHPTEVHANADHTDAAHVAELHIDVVDTSIARHGRGDTVTGSTPDDGVWKGCISFGFDPTVGRRRRTSVQGRTRAELDRKIDRLIAMRGAQ